MHIRHQRFLAISAALGAAALLVGAAAQPVPIRRDEPTRRPIEGPRYAAWIPPGTYSAIVLNSSGDQRRWAVSLISRSTNVPIVVPPSDNIIIEFKDGWTVSANDEARLVSNLVPFDDSALFNKVGEQPKYVLSAWGISASGPVQFAYREIKD